MGAVIAAFSFMLFLIALAIFEDIYGEQLRKDITELNKINKKLKKYNKEISEITKGKNQRNKRG